MGLYPSLETGDRHRLQHVAEVRSRLEKERDFRASLTRNNGAGLTSWTDLTSRFQWPALAWSLQAFGLLLTIIVVPVAIGIQAGAIVCELLGTGGKFLGRRLQTKARKHDQIRVLAESKINTIADHISTVLTDDKISDEEFRLILFVETKYNQMKADIRKRPKQGLSEDV